MGFGFGDMWNEPQIRLFWKPEREMIECLLAHWSHGGWGWNGGRDFAPERRISLKLAVGDGRQTLFHENNRILSLDAWPADCNLRIGSEFPDSAIIHRCSLRPLTEQDVAACGWETPPTDLAVTLAEEAARRAKIAEAFPGGPAPTYKRTTRQRGWPRSSRAIPLSRKTGSVLP